MLPCVSHRSRVRIFRTSLQQCTTKDDDGDSPTSTSRMVLTEQDCSSLIKKMVGAAAAFELPSECYRRAGSVNKHDGGAHDAAMLTAFVGMDPGSAIKAMSARDHGHPHSAQITRRLTTRSKPSESSWF